MAEFHYLTPISVLLLKPLLGAIGVIYWNSKHLLYLLLVYCCSNHSSLKNKWSHNEQSSPIGYQVKSGGITRELDKEPSLHYSSIYTTTSWSMLQQCVYLMSIHHASTLRLPCFLYVPWRHTFNLCCTCAHHVYTMRNPCPLMSSSNPNFF